MKTNEAKQQDDNVIAISDEARTLAARRREHDEAQRAATTAASALRASEADFAQSGTNDAHARLQAARAEDTRARDFLGRADRLLEEATAAAHRATAASKRAELLAERKQLRESMLSPADIAAPAVAAILAAKDAVERATFEVKRHDVIAERLNNIAKELGIDEHVSDLRTEGLLATVRIALFRRVGTLNLNAWVTTCADATETAVSAARIVGRELLDYLAWFPASKALELAEHAIAGTFDAVIAVERRARDEREREGRAVAAKRHAERDAEEREMGRRRREAETKGGAHWEAYVVEEAAWLAKRGRGAPMAGFVGGGQLRERA